jgi:glycine/D-amino acid oxidase-like deaminating enzyme/nitrite reductase/ring-hydroxylating ferredoxin subunit
MGTERSGDTRSAWMPALEAGGEVASEMRAARGALDEDAVVDVCVVGAGIAGLMCAWQLVQEERSVLVLDTSVVGGGETGRTTAHLASAQDDRFVVLERLHGEDGARRAAASHAAAIDLFERICREQRIDCDFARVDGYLFAREGGDPAGLERELDAARRAGLDAVLDRQPPYDPFRSGAAIRFARQARFHPLRFLGGVARAFEAAGGRICEHTKVVEVEGGENVVVRTAGGQTVRAASCIVATNSPISDRVVTHVKEAPYRTYVVALRVPPGSVPDALYWDDGDPYLYVRLQPGSDHDLLIVGGEDHKTGQRDDGEARFARLERWTRERFPMATTLEHRWSGQVFEPHDGVALTGAHPGRGMDNVWLHTGDSGQGITHGGIAGLLLTDLIVGRSNDWAQLYDPGRITLRAGREFARENLNVAAQYAAYVLPGEVAGVDEVPAGEGRIVRRGAKLIAAYRAPDGTLTERSAVCTHMGCAVDWNSVERTWDCPCHGSRFAVDGSVVTGPAVAPLAGLDEPARQSEEEAGLRE